MTYEIEHLAQELKSARLARGMSQRALSKATQLPQSHISKIENGAVDLRLSSLVAITRVLGLELALVPRHALPAVQSITRTAAGRAVGIAHMTAKGEQRRNAAEELAKIRNNLDRAPAIADTSNEVSQIRRALRELSHFPFNEGAIVTVREVNKTIRELSKKKNKSKALQEALRELQGLRNRLAHSGAETTMQSDRAQPAYSLDTDDHD